MSDGSETSENRYILPRELDLLAAEDLKEKMLDYLHQDSSLVLEAGEVERVSTPCISVIYSAGVAFHEAGRKFQIENPSSYLNDGLTALGLDDYFQSWRTS